MHKDAGGVGRVVVDLAYFDFSFLERFEDGLDDSAGSLAEWNFGDGQGGVVEFLDFRAHLDCTPALAVVVAGHVDESPCGEVGQESEFLAAQTGHGGLQNFIEVVGKNLG